MNLLELIDINKKLINITDNDNVIANNNAINQMKQNSTFCQYLSEEMTKIEQDPTYISEDLEIKSKSHKNHFELSNGTFVGVTDKGLDYFKVVINAAKIKEELKNQNLDIKDMLSLGACLYSAKNPMSESPHTEFSESYVDTLKDRYIIKTNELLDNISTSFENGQYDNAYKNSLQLQTAANSSFFNTKESLIATEIMNFSFAAKDNNNNSTQSFINNSIKKFKESKLFQKEDINLSVKLKHNN
jgi:hypothetical protein